jgi:hypothetical protein
LTLVHRFLEASVTFMKHKHTSRLKGPRMELRNRFGPGIALAAGIALVGTISAGTAAGAPLPRACLLGAAPTRLPFADLAPSAPTHPRAAWRFEFNVIRHAELTWRDTSNNEDGFTAEWWNEDPVLGWVLVETTSAGVNATSVHFGVYDPAMTGRHNRFRVRAFNAAGASDWSSWVSLNLH